MKWKRGESLGVLHFDIEARPLSWYAGDFVTREVTAIACKWAGRPKIYCWALGECDLLTVLGSFRSFYDEAGIVSGHYIRGYDLPNLNGAFMELGLPPLSAKLTSDTKLDLIKRSGLSVSQENLGAMFGLKHDKVQMSQADWRAANRLTPDGIRKTKTRVRGDVVQHEELRAKLLERGLLGPPKMWTPGAGWVASYEP